jgi:hypothetical protein
MKTKTSIKAGKGSPLCRPNPAGLCPPPAPVLQGP